MQPLHVELMIQECADLQWPVKCSERCDKDKGGARRLGRGGEGLGWSWMKCNRVVGIA